MPSDFLVQRLRPADLDRILEIEHACFRKDAYDRKLFAGYVRRCGDYFLVARRLGKGVVRSGTDAAPSKSAICGYILSCPCREGAELVSLAVEPAARRVGAASALMDSTLRRLKRRGVGRLILMVRITNRGAIRFYKGYGFAKVRIVHGYYEDGRDGWLMTKDLRPGGPSR